MKKQLTINNLQFTFSRGVTRAGRPYERGPELVSRRKGHRAGEWQDPNGFTLIELLVVISIIGILAALGLVSYTTAQRQARDTQRKSDIKQYQTILEQYANGKGGLFPAHPAVVAANTVCGASDLNLSITCPVDPKAGTPPYGYEYISNGTVGTTATNYALYARLETSANYWVICENGTALTQPDVPTLANCP